MALDPRRRRRGAAPVDEGHRAAEGADRAPGPQGELLVDGGPRPRRPLLGDPLRPRTGVRPRRRVRHHHPHRDAGRARGPLPRDLEPGLHAGRAERRPQQGGLRHPRCAAAEEHRHRHGPRAGRLPAPGQAEHVRDRRHVPRDRAGDGAHRPPLRRRPGRRRPVPGGRRPRAQLDDAGRRRRHPRQRGPRLRAAPAAAPRRPLGAAARLRGPRAARAAAGQPRQDGGDLPARCTGLGADLHRGLRRGAGLPADPARRHLDLRPRHHRAEEVRLHASSPATGPSPCTTPTASRSTSPSRWRPSRGSPSTRRASAG